MIVVIDPAQGNVIVDEVSRSVDLAGIDTDIERVDFNTDTGVGLIQRAAENESIGQSKFDLVFRKYLQAWNVAGYTDPRTLAERRASIVEEIKGYRNDRSNRGGYLVSAKWFHSDQPSRTQQIALVMLGASVPPVPWKTMDGTFIAMSQALATGIFQAAVSKDVATFGVAETHIAAVNASDDPESYDYKTGWPAIFGE